MSRADLLVLAREPVDDPDEVGRPEVELELVAHPQPRQVEQLIDQPNQLGRALVDDVEAFGQLLRSFAIGPRDRALEEVGIALDDRGRRLEVVRDGRQELVLLPIEIAQRADVLEDRHASRSMSLPIEEWRAVHEDRHVLAGDRVRDDELFAADDLATEDGAGKGMIRG